MFEQTKVAAVFNANPTAKEVGKALGRRERDRSVTNLNWFKYDLLSGPGQPSIAMNDFITVFSELEKLGVGSLIRGRKQKNGTVTPPRFNWNYSIKDIARAAAGQIDKTEVKKVEAPKAKTIRTEAKSEVTAPVTANKVTGTPREMVLNGPGLSLKIDLSKDLSPETLTALVDLVKGLDK